MDASPTPPDLTDTHRPGNTAYQPSAPTSQQPPYGPPPHHRLPPAPTLPHIPVPSLLTPDLTPPHIPLPYPKPPPCDWGWREAQDSDDRAAPGRQLQP
eukprot:10396272-Heterocapsa_arctica.AAC.1